MGAFSQYSSSSTLLATNLVSSASLPHASKLLYMLLLQEFSSGLAVLQVPDDLMNWRFHEWTTVELGDDFRFCSSKIKAQYPKPGPYMMRVFGPGRPHVGEGKSHASFPQDFDCVQASNIVNNNYTGLFDTRLVRISGTTQWDGVNDVGSAVLMIHNEEAIITFSTVDGRRYNNRVELMTLARVHEQSVSLTTGTGSILNQLYHFPVPFGRPAVIRRVGRSGIAQSSTLWAKPEPPRSIQGIKWKLNILVNKFIYDALGSPLPYPNRLATTPLPFFYLEAKSKPSRMIDPLIEETDPAHRRLYEEVVNKKNLKREIQVTLSSLFVAVLQFAEGKLAKTKNCRRKENLFVVALEAEIEVLKTGMLQLFDAYKHLLLEEELAPHR
ncbi:uncharacterized protein ARMOST_22586 [Armillaria ostoyae]|uniref:Uncharacterized protein n=1 Tax=Armillaria ostoyae TaxID=47428 RepID=A0A284SDA4_ARMOS|nr:uncharacterized protein ARMOST_22586 [Armillaria ostoyae]